jgi:hypothetical protein
LRSINGGRGQVEPTDEKEDRSEPSTEIKKRINQPLETEDRIEEEYNFLFLYFINTYITIKEVDVIGKNLALK